MPLPTVSLLPLRYSPPLTATHLFHVSPFLRPPPPSANAAVDYDMAFQPCTACLDDPKLVLESTGMEWPEILRLPASDPPTPSLKIQIAELPWELSVHPTGNSRFITISDVLQWSYSELRKAVSEPEFYGLVSEARRGKVTEAYLDRCERGVKKKDADREFRKGVKRVDFLEGKTKFGGLIPTDDPGLWVMHVSS